MRYNMTFKFLEQSFVYPSPTWGVQGVPLAPQVVNLAMYGGTWGDNPPWKTNFPWDRSDFFPDRRICINGHQHTAFERRFGRTRGNPPWLGLIELNQSSTHGQWLKGVGFETVNREGELRVKGLS